MTGRCAGLAGLNGLDLQERISADRAEMPIIFVTGHSDVPMTVRAMKGGARGAGAGVRG